ncbi:hypothetical protein MPNT_10177 [Candidatus Methylacidithermus pantelleriae]|uniref:Uncharacterized protein n=1 Tax=Candidatus Methylacidithermus pantelleriae TaxID=2744239 RepID=A0A8J2BK67_9BACT|nr:hypothetical protein MPNT_10177 [Candidatus Methylacidithermus pantelleriae]
MRDRQVVMVWFVCQASQKNRRTTALRGRWEPLMNKVPMVT